MALFSAILLHLGTVAGSSSGTPLHSYGGPHRIEREGIPNLAAEDNLASSLALGGRHSHGHQVETSVGAQRFDNTPDRRKTEHFRPVSITVYCVMVLTFQSLVIYSALALARNADELSGHTNTPSLLTDALSAAARSIAYPPMMCCLFVACRMYVLATTEGLGEPQWWAKVCMMSASAGMTLQFCIVLALPLFTIQVKDLTFSAVTGDSSDAHPRLQRHQFTSSCSKITYWFFQILCMSGIYGGVSGVVLAVFTYPEGTTQVSPAVVCTVCLSCLYFVVFLLHWLAYAWAELDARVVPDAPSLSDRGGNSASCSLEEGWEVVAVEVPTLSYKFSKGMECTIGATSSMALVVRKAPMLAVLFLASRMRALQLNPPHGMPPPWAQACFVAAVVAICCETVVAAYIGCSGEVQKGYYGVNTYLASPAAHAAQSMLELVTFATLPPIYHANIMMTGSDGLEAPLSTTLRCVFYFAAMFFGIDFMRCMAAVAHYVGRYSMEMMLTTLTSASVSVSFSPLLSILFVACRMRALQITQQQGSPQHWAQTCMYFCVFATALQAITCLILPVFTRGATHVDPDGNTVYDLKPMVGAYCVTIVKYVALFCLHGATLGICASILLITPETAQRGPPARFAEHILQWSGLSIVVLLVAMLLGSAKVIGLAVKFAIESVDDTLLGVQITVDAAALALCRGYVNVTGLIVHNPDEEEAHEQSRWVSPCLAKIDKLVVKLNMGRLLCTLGKEFEITCVNIQGVDVNFEKLSLFGDASNVQMVLNHLEGVTSGDKILDKEDEKTSTAEHRQMAKEAKKEAKAKADAEAKARAEERLASLEDEPEPVPGPKIIVHELNIQDIGAAAYIKGVPLRAAIADIVFPNFMDHLNVDNLGQGNGASSAIIAEITKIVMRSLMKSVMVNVRPLLLTGMRQAAVASLDSHMFGKQCKSIFGCNRRPGGGKANSSVGTPVHTM